MKKVRLFSLSRTLSRSLSRFLSRIVVKQRGIKNFQVSKKAYLRWRFGNPQNRYHYQ